MENCGNKKTMTTENKDNTNTEVGFVVNEIVMYCEAEKLY